MSNQNNMSTTQGEKKIEIPKEWLERLIALSESVLSTTQTAGNEHREYLKGYIESVKYLLGK